jgi:hypothetical protein
MTTFASDNFESFPTGWTTGGSVIEKSGTQKHGGSYSCRIYAINSTSIAYGSKAFTRLGTVDHHNQIWVYVDSSFTGDNDILISELYDVTAGKLSQISGIKYHDSAYYFQNEKAGGIWEDVCTLTADTWYKIDMYYNYTTGKIHYYVDDVKQGGDWNSYSGAGVRPSINYVGDVSSTAGLTNGYIYLDDWILDDATEISTETLGYSTDIVFKQMTTKTYDVDFVLKKTDTTKTYNIDFISKKTNTMKAYDADVVTKDKDVLKTYLMDLLTSVVQSSPYDIDTILKALSEIKTYDLDVAIKKENTVLTYIIDALLQRLDDIKTYSIDLKFVEQFTITYLFDVLLRLTTSLSYSVDVLILGIATFDWILERGYVLTEPVSVPKWVSELFKMDTNIWNRTAREVIFKTRVTDSQKNDLRKNYTKCIMGVSDGIYTYTCWLKAMTFAKADHKDRQWIATLTFYILYSSETLN